MAPARHGLAGTAQFQMARNGLYWHGTAWVRHGMFWLGTVLLRQGTARFDMARFRHGTVWHGLVLARHGLARFDPGTVWHGLVVARHGSARFELGTARHGLVLARHGLVLPPSQPSSVLPSQTNQPANKPWPARPGSILQASRAKTSQPSRAKPS